MKHLTQEQTDALLHDDTEPKFKPWQPVIVRDYDDEAWEPQFFSHYANNSELLYCCMGTGYRQCLPAKGNRHLIGTTNSPASSEPEPESEDANTQA